MSVLETVLRFVVPTVGILALLTALVVVPRMARRPRYRTGQAWAHPPLWWSANPDGANLSEPAAATRGGERGGARGVW